MKHNTQHLLVFYQVATMLIRSLIQSNKRINPLKPLTTLNVCTSQLSCWPKVDANELSLKQRQTHECNSDGMIVLHGAVINYCVL